MADVAIQLKVGRPLAAVRSSMSSMAPISRATSCMCSAIVQSGTRTLEARPLTRALVADAAMLPDSVARHPRAHAGAPVGRDDHASRRRRLEKDEVRAVGHDVVVRMRIRRVLERVRKERIA